MIKARNKKLSLILVLAMLVTMFAGLGTASASSDYVSISGSYTYVTADDGVNPGTITTAVGDDTYTGDFDKVYAEVTLPEGVTLTDSGNSSFTVSADKTTDLATTLAALTTAINNKFHAEGTIDIDSDYTGSVTASVEVWGTLTTGTAPDTTTSTVFDITDNATIAKVASGDVTVTAKTAKSVSVGDGQAGAKITVKESSPGALTDGDGQYVTFTIKGSGVTWDKANTISRIVDGTTVYGVTSDPSDLISTADTTTNTFTNTKTLKVYIDTATSAYKGSISVTPYFKVEPGASGDVVVKVSGTDVDSTDLTVATVGASSTAVTVDKGTKDSVYQGQTAELSDVKITLDPSNTLSDDDYFTLTLPDGMKWYNDDWTTTEDAASVDSGDAELSGLYNDDQSLWVSVNTDDTSDDIVLNDLYVVADADAAVGDLNVTLGGSATGTYQIGTIKAPMTVTTTPFSIASTGTVTGGAITITEADAGALIATDSSADKVDGTPKYLDITLPMGVTFADTPKVKVTDGDLTLGEINLSSDSDVLQIEIDTDSNVASTISITGLTYNIDNRAAEGTIVAKVGKAYNLESSTALTTVNLGTIGLSSASFVIGASTYTTADGTVVTCVAPSFISNSRSYLAIRDIAHVLGITDSNILWDGTNNTVTLMKGDKVVQLKVGSNVMYVNGAAVTMDTTVQNVNSRTFLPAAFVAQAFGATATWDGATSTVTIK